MSNSNYLKFDLTPFNYNLAIVRQTQIRIIQVWGNIVKVVSAIINLHDMHSRINVRTHACPSIMWGLPKTKEERKEKD